MFQVCWPGYTSEHKSVHWTARNGHKSGWHGDWMMISMAGHGKALTVRFHWQGRDDKAWVHEFKAADSDFPDHYIGHNWSEETIEIFLKDVKSVNTKFFSMLKDGSDERSDFVFLYLPARMSGTETFSVVYVKMTFEYVHHRGKHASSDTLELQMFQVCWLGYTSEHKSVHWTARNGHKSGWHGDWTMINMAGHGKVLTVRFHWQGKDDKAWMHEFKAVESQSDVPDHFVGCNWSHETIEIFLKDVKRVHKGFFSMIQDSSDSCFDDFVFI